MGSVPARPRPAWTSRLPAAALLLGAALLLLPALGAVRLWQDEAETALLGRAVRREGLPRVWDGRNLVAQYYSLDFDSRLLFQKGWLPAYAVAASFAAIGESTFAARLPFVLFALAAVVLCRRLARRLGAGEAEAFLAAALLASSLPFLLYARQCRWYSLAMALTLLLFEAEDRLGERAGSLRLGLVAAALFHVNVLVCATTLAGLAVARLATRGRAALDAPLLRAGAIAAALCVPFLVLFPPFAFAGAATQLGGYPHRLGWILADFSRWILPLPGFVLLLAISRGRPLRDPGIRRLLIAFAVAVTLAAVPMWQGLVEIVGFRYAVNLLPVGAILFARALAALPLRPWLPLGALALHLATHALGFPLPQLAGTPPEPLLRTDLPDYLGSLRRPAKGPIDAAVEYLSPRVRKGDALFTPYEQLPFQFYLPVRTVGLQGAASTLERLGIALPAYVGDLAPDDLDWYVPRADWNSFLGAPPPERLLGGLVARGVSFERAVLAGPDTTWQAREYPLLHRFRDPADAPRVVVFRFTRGPGLPLPAR
jgi:hypothetical protein